MISEKRKQQIDNARAFLETLKEGDRIWVRFVFYCEWSGDISDQEGYVTVKTNYTKNSSSQLRTVEITFITPQTLIEWRYIEHTGILDTEMVVEDYLDKNNLLTTGTTNNALEGT